LIERDKNSATVKINNIQWLGDTIDNLAIKHANSFYTDRYLCIPIIKGWPAIGTSNYIKEKDKSLDIFEKEFYKTSKLVALFDKLTLQFIANVGTLSNKTANLQSGFYYTSIRGTETPRSIVLSDGSGELQLVSKKNFKTTRVIIPPYESHLKEKEEGKDGTNSLLKLHTSEEKYYELRSKDFESPIEYLNSLSIFYENKIIEVKYFSKHLYVLIKNKAKNYQVLRLKVIRNKKLKLLGNIELKRNFDRSKQIQNIQFETNGNQIYLSSFYTEGESAFYGLKEITNAFQIIK
jgi:hypothetical protein